MTFPILCQDSRYKTYASKSPLQIMQFRMLQILHSLPLDYAPADNARTSHVGTNMCKQVTPPVK